MTRKKKSARRRSRPSARPRSEPRRSEARADLDAAAAHFQSGDLDLATLAFHRALAHAPLSAEALMGLGLVHHTRGELAEAELMFLKATVAGGDPETNGLALEHLAGIARQRERWSEAASYLERVLQTSALPPSAIASLEAQLDDVCAAEARQQSGASLAADPTNGAGPTPLPAAPTPALGYRAAFVDIDITPTLSATDRVAVQGYWGKARRAHEVDSPLRMQVLLLEDARRTKLLVVTADLFGFDPDMVGRVREMASGWGIEPEGVLLNASHTHYAPGTLSRVLPGLGAFFADYAGQICALIGVQLPKLYQRLASCALSWGRARVRVGVNRRRKHAGRMVMAPNPDGIYDDDTPYLVLAFAEPSQRIVLVNHGCHPTGMGAAATVSAGFPGAFRARLMERVGRSALAGVMFLQGAGGDVKPVADPDSSIPRFAASPEESHRVGVRLADAIFDSWRPDGEPHHGLTPLTGSFHCARRVAKVRLHPGPTVSEVVASADSLQIDRALVEEWARMMTQEGGQAQSSVRTAAHHTFEVQTVSIGGARIHALPGEPVAGLGRALRASDPAGESPEVTFVLGYTNGLVGYFPTDAVIAEGGYEAHDAHFVYGLTSAFAPGFETTVRRVLAECETVRPRRVPVPDSWPSNRHSAFFVLSTGRCGTQTLAHLLMNKPNARVWHHPEPNLILETLWAYWGVIDKRAVFWDGRGRIIHDAWSRGLIHGETDHNMTPFCDIIAEDIPEARFVILIRDPRDFVRSGMRRGYYRLGNSWDQGRLRPREDDPRFLEWKQRDPFAKVCWLWAETYRRIGWVTRSIEPERLTVARFEDLVAPGPLGGRTISRIQTFLGVDGHSDAAAQSVLAQKLNAQQGGAFPPPCDWTPELHDRLWDECGELAAAFGYPETYGSDDSPHSEAPSPTS